MRGEWIEIYTEHGKRAHETSLPMRGEWIEIYRKVYKYEYIFRSLPMRGEWIEIECYELYIADYKVSPHAGRVD